MSDENVEWLTDLSVVPCTFCQRSVDIYCSRKNLSGPSSRTSQRSYKLHCESYTDPSSVRVARSSSPGDVMIKCTCYRSQRKTSKPYTVSVKLDASGAVKSVACQCAAGLSGACSHGVASLKLLVTLKESNYKEPPPEVACTELPQQWRRPRSNPLAPLPLDFVDWRSVRQDGLSEPISTRAYDARKDVPPFEDIVKRTKSLGAELAQVMPSPFSRMLQKADMQECMTSVGPTAVGSPCST